MPRHARLPRTGHRPDQRQPLARITELLDVLDGSLRLANIVGDHLADYLHEA
jgi:hypothetical protein